MSASPRAPSHEAPPSSTRQHRCIQPIITMPATTSTTTYFTHVDSPVGRLMIAGSDEGLRAVEFPSSQHPVPRHGSWQMLDPDDIKGLSNGTAKADGTGGSGEPTPPVQVINLLRNTQRQLDDYFAGQRQHFELPLAPQGTPFQLQVWQALRAIPYGETWSYAQLAEHIGNPRSVRAVGAANGKNPIAIIIPCHRVIGANGSLVGFGGGLATKEKLLSLESAQQRLSLPEA